MRPISLRAPLSFQQRCEQCSRIRDEQFFEQDGDRCAFCIRKAERIAEGLFVPGRSSRPSGVRAQHRRRKFDTQSAITALQEWKTARRATLETQGIVYGAAASVIEEELPAVRERLGME